MIYEQGSLVYPDESQFLSRTWQLPHPVEQQTSPFSSIREPHSVGILDVESGRVITRLMPELQRELELLEVHENWSEPRLITWLDRNIPHPDLPATETTVWIFGVLRELQKQGNSLGARHSSSVHSTADCEQRFAGFRKRAQRSHFQDLLFAEGAANRVKVETRHSFEFDRYAYPARWICAAAKRRVPQALLREGSRRTSRTGRGIPLAPRIILFRP